MDNWDVVYFCLKFFTMFQLTLVAILDRRDILLDDYNFITCRRQLLMNFSKNSLFRHSVPQYIEISSISRALKWNIFYRANTLQNWGIPVRLL
jgi:hypothetical protein